MKLINLRHFGMIKIMIILTALTISGCGKQEATTSQTKNVSSATTDDLSKDVLIEVGRTQSGLVFYESNKGLCAKVKDIPSKMAEGIASKYGVSNLAVRFIRAVPPESSSSTDCYVVVDTPVGPKQCAVGSLLQVNGSWVGTPLVWRDGKVLMDTTGVCEKV